VEQICQQVIIINKGSLVATDSVENLRGRARGAETMVLEVSARSGMLDAANVQQKLESVAGVSRVAIKGQHDSSAVFETESGQGKLVRGDLARAVIEAGWDLNELRPAAMSLEEIFLQLTASEAATPGAGAQNADAKAQAAGEGEQASAEEPNA
jgi:ABC-2 type transport system ATP-binding protein